MGTLGTPKKTDTHPHVHTPTTTKWYYHAALNSGIT